MDAVEPRRHDEAGKPPLGLRRQPQIRVMEQDREQEQRLPQPERGGRYADRRNLPGPPRHR